MILCVGAASQRVVEEAAKLRVHQIVASRRQVGETVPGYTGYTSATLTEAVRTLSGSATNVVRDHGGPYQNGQQDDDWTTALDADIDAGFDGLHLDVCHLDVPEQHRELVRLCQRYEGRTAIEVGGERDTAWQLRALLEAAQTVCQPYAGVAALGGHVWADRQCGHIVSPAEAEETAALYRGPFGVVMKAHNFDWWGGRREYAPGSLYNVAPEFGNVEVDAWLHLLPHAEGQEIMNYAWVTGAWSRWFNPGEGTHFERARAALRYHLNAPEVRAVLDRHDDSFVREVIRDALLAG